MSVPKTDTPSAIPSTAIAGAITIADSFSRKINLAVRARACVGTITLEVKTNTQTWPVRAIRQPHRPLTCLGSKPLWLPSTIKATPVAPLS